MNSLLNPLINLGIACFFILSLHGLTFPHSAYRSNMLGAVGMCLTLLWLLITCTHPILVSSAIILGIIIGTFISQKIKITALPQTVAILNGFGGLSAFLIATCAILEGNTDILDIPISAIIGIFTFSGSLIAYAKLQGILKKSISLSQILNILIFTVLLATLIEYIMHPDILKFGILSLLAFTLGLLITLKIGGADMPIVISLLNACSGLDSAAIGFVINNPLLIITGALIGVSGSILSYIMCKAMNRSLWNVLFGTNVAPSAQKSTDTLQHSVKTGTPSEAAFIMENARKIIIVPGYGMAVAQAQHILRQLTNILSNKYNVDVKFAIHPIAGRMPGHINVLLAEADVPYEKIFSLDDINNEFPSTDVAYVIGANDITNPLAKTDSSSAIFGMPILNVSQAKTVFVVKRSLAGGYTGLDNPLFYADNTIMLFGDAKKVTSEIIKNLEH